MGIESFTRVIEGLRQGEKMEEKDFDMKLFRLTDSLVKKHDIRYDPQVPIPNDPAMADRLFEAAQSLYADLGTYCTDTRTVIRFSPDEMEKALQQAPQATEWGQGPDAFTLTERSVEGDEPLFIMAGLQTLLYSDEDTMFSVYRDCCRCPDVAGVCGGIVPRVSGVEEFRSGSPEEIFPYHRSALLLRKAAADAGRPGMVVENGAPTNVADFPMYAGETGFRTTDPVGSGGVAEMKTSLDRLQKVAFALATDTHLSGAQGSMIGGFSGSVEGAALIMAAGTYQCILINQGEVAQIKTTPTRSFSRATRQSIWVCALALQAVSRNSHVILTCCNGDHPAAGPGTAVYFYETTAGSLPVIVCGAHKSGGTRKFKIGTTPDFGSPVESDFLGHVCQAMKGMDIETANRAAIELLDRYEPVIKDPPAGATLREIYDLDKSVPRKPYLTLYNDVASELRDLGIPLNDYPG